MNFRFSPDIQKQLQDVFDCFISLYGNILDNSYSNLKDVSFAIVKLGANDFNFDSNSPLHINPTEGVIYVNDISGLSDFEIHALIAHEIGHYIGEGKEKEDDCDKIAVSIGLRDSMKSAITKMIANLEKKENVEIQLGLSTYSKLLSELKTRLNLLQ